MDAIYRIIGLLLLASGLRVCAVSPSFLSFDTNSMVVSSALNFIGVRPGAASSSAAAQIFTGNRVAYNGGFYSFPNSLTAGIQEAINMFPVATDSQKAGGGILVRRRPSYPSAPRSPIPSARDSI